MYRFIAAKMRFQVLINAEPVQHLLWQRRL